MYQALYRKYRPATFDDVISQSHITTTLKKSDNERQNCSCLPVHRFKRNG